MGHDLRNALTATSGKYSLLADVITTFFADLDEVIGQIDPSGRLLERSQEEELARYCIVLALFEEVSRVGPSDRSPLFVGEAKTTTSALLAIPEPH
jgi:hypothetical protein